MVYCVQSSKDLLLKVIPHFDKYPLLTKKGKDFFLFKKIVNSLSEKRHLSYIGLQNIMNLRASMNKGLSILLKESFPNTIPFNEYETPLHKEIDPN
jgi:hypothetical protein